MNITSDISRCQDFLHSIETIYSTHSIYRTIIICNENIDLYVDFFKKKDYDVLIIDKYEYINYDLIDKRIFIIKENMFISFIKDVNNNDIYKDIIFYNLLAFTKNSNKEGLLLEYRKIVKHNCDFII
jgi:hypothetical protein